jgi:pimeloyl-ACP methyl ester carboxylesterase
MVSVPVCLIHGAATTSTVWARVCALLPPNLVVSCPTRPSSGNLDTEIDALVGVVTGAVAVGVSGGATLCLELAARGVPFRVALAHEPAVGSLRPGLLAPMAAAYSSGGTEAFARTLYGPSWTPDLAPSDPEAVKRDLAMFRAFEPRPPIGPGRLITSVGQESPPIRHEAAHALGAAFDLPIRVLPHASHAVHLDQPAVLAAAIVELARAE